METKKQKAERELTPEEKFVGRWIIFFIPLLAIMMTGVIILESQKGSSPHKKDIMRFEQQQLFAENQKLLAEVPNLIRSFAKAVNKNAVVETDSGLTETKRDTIDSVPCCGDPTELPPVANLAESPQSSTSEIAPEIPVSFEEAFDNELEQIIAQMPEETQPQIRNFFAKINAFESSLGEADLAELERMKADVREQFTAQEAMLMPEAELDLTEEEQEAREKGREKMVHFRAVSTLMAQKRRAAVERRIRESRQMIQNIVSTPEEREQQDAVQAVTDLAFPPNEE